MARHNTAASKNRSIVSVNSTYMHFLKLMVNFVYFKLAGSYCTPLSVLPSVRQSVLGSVRPIIIIIIIFISDSNKQCQS